MNDCIFCRIIRGTVPKDFTFQSENLVAFPDINPAADLHILIVPKSHIGAIEDLNKSHGPLLAEVYETANKLIRENNLENDLYRVVVNGGKAQHVPHLHFHLLGGQWKKAI